VDNDPSQIIPVGPIPFERDLPHFARGITSGRPKIVAIGSSTTAGEGNIKPYPDRLLSLLQIPYPNAKITMINAGIGGQARSRRVRDAGVRDQSIGARLS
jgi:hypothetical protein